MGGVSDASRSPRAQAHRRLRQVLESRVVEALATPHGIDHHLVTLGAGWATADPPARVVDARRTTPGTVTLTLRPGPRWAGHQAGQHVTLTVPVGGARRSRCFSIASSAHTPGGTVELTVKATGRGGVSDHLVASGCPGQSVQLSPPAGTFVLPAERPPHVVMVSGGSGITPVLSMLRTLHDEGHPGTVSFLHYARAPADVVAAAELARLAARHRAWRIVVALTGPPGAAVPPSMADAPAVARLCRLAGRFRADHLSALAPGAAQAPVWVCGPGRLAADVASAWRAAGDAPVHVERYRLDPPPAAGGGGRVRFTRSGVEVVDDGRSLLVQAEGAGLAPAHGCRAGQCHTCVRRMPAGAVRDVRTGDVVDEPGALVQICVSVPEGGVEIDL